MMKVRHDCPNCENTIWFKLKEVREDTRKKMHGPKSEECGDCGAVVTVGSVTTYIDIAVHNQPQKKESDSDTKTESLGEYMDENASKTGEDLI